MIPIRPLYLIGHSSPVDADRRVGQNIRARGIDGAVEQDLLPAFDLGFGKPIFKNPGGCRTRPGIETQMRVDQYLLASQQAPWILKGFERAMALISTRWGGSGEIYVGGPSAGENPRYKSVLEMPAARRAAMARLTGQADPRPMYFKAQCRADLDPWLKRGARVWLDACNGAFPGCSEALEWWVQFGVDLYDRGLLCGVEGYWAQDERVLEIPCYGTSEQQQDIDAGLCPYLYTGAPKALVHVECNSNSGRAIAARPGLAQIPGTQADWEAEQRGQCPRLRAWCLEQIGRGRVPLISAQWFVDRQVDVQAWLKAG